MNDYGKIADLIAGHVLERYEPSPMCLELSLTELTAPEAIACLIDKKQYFDFVQFMAHALPPRESIWWGVLSLEERANDWTELEMKALVLAKRWVLDPEEASRIQAHQIAEKIGLDSAVSWLAEAVFWSGGGSILDPGFPELLPPEFQYGHGVSASVNVAAVQPEWQNEEDADQFYELVINHGMSVSSTA